MHAQDKKLSLRNQEAGANVYMRRRMYHQKGSNVSPLFFGQHTSHVVKQMSTTLTCLTFYHEQIQAYEVRRTSDSIMDRVSYLIYKSYPKMDRS